jgi:hypothetical protein
MKVGVCWERRGPPLLRAEGASGGAGQGQGQGRAPSSRPRAGRRALPREAGPVPTAGPARRASLKWPQLRTPPRANPRRRGRPRPPA